MEFKIESHLVLNMVQKTLQSSIDTNIFLKKNFFFRKFENFLTRCGAKEQVVGSVVKALAIVANFSKKSSTWLLWCLFKKLHTRVEFRAVFLKGRKQYFPFFLRKTRTMFLITNLLMGGIKGIENKEEEKKKENEKKKKDEKDEKKKEEEKKKKDLKEKRQKVKKILAIEVSRLCLAEALKKRVISKKIIEANKEEPTVQNIIMAQRLENVDKVLKDRAKMHYRW